jgi:outer membrane protein OmpA-like peptidoglycan-associated protein
MFSQDDESTGVALGVVFGVIFLVLSLVFGVVMYQKNKTAKAQMAASTATAPAPAAASAVAAAATGAAAGAAAAGATNAKSEEAMALAAQAAAGAASVKVENGVVMFYFASGKADLAQGGAKALAEILTSAKTGKKIGISGFVDASGDAKKNAELAKKRAFAVKDLLLSNGVPDSQIVLVRPNDIKAGTISAAESRRVEVFTL